MRFTNASGVRNDLLQEISDDTSSLINLAISTVANTIPLRDFTSDLPIAFGSTITAAPHAALVRFGYTVPADKIAYVSGIALGIMQSVAAAGFVGGINKLIITPNGAGASIIQHIDVPNNTINIFNSISVPSNYVLRASDKIEWETTDSGTGGTVYYNMCASIMEFDA